MTESKRIHVIGIGGSAMAPLAGMLRERGYRVTGSDSGVYPPASTLLESLGISFFHSFDAAHLQPAPDLVIVGNIIARGNPELEEVLDRKIPYRSLPEMLEEVFLPGQHSIVVSGTHGKTTTTAMLAWIFQTAGRKPNFLVGGVAENFGKSYGLGRWRGIYSGRRRVRDGFLGSRAEIFPLPSRRFDHHFAGIRSRGHLPRLRDLPIGISRGW